MFQALLKNYQKKLVNLSGSNRALVLLRLSKEQDLDLQATDFVLNKPAFQLIENLIAGRSSFPLSQLLDSRNEKSNLVGKQLQRIARKDQFLFEESGAQDLYVGWPFARGQFMDGTVVHCPLLFFPVHLKLEDNVWHLEQRDNEPISLNKTFLLAWQFFNKVTLSEEFLETSFEGFSKDAREFRTQLYEVLKANGLELHFNSDLFVDKLEAFKEYKSAQLLEDTELGRIKLFHEAVLGIFPQAGSYLVPDYEKLLEQNEFEHLEDFLGEKMEGDLPSNERGKARLDNIKESDLHTPLPLDAPQENAIKWIKNGQSLVVQGPPGTGKSQLIANLVSDYISRGKKVLVVCQKRAALDVVFKRLDHIGAGDFIALVHDFKADRQVLYEKIAKQIDQIDAYKKANNSLDAVFLERHYLEECRKIDRSVQEFEQFKFALFDTTECGISVKELYLTIDTELPKFPELESGYKHFHYDQLSSFLNKLIYLLAPALEFDGPAHPWNLRPSFKSFTDRDKSALATSLTAIHYFTESFEKEFPSLERTIQEVWELKEHRPLFFQLQALAQNEVFYVHFYQFAEAKNKESKWTKWQKKLTKWKERVQEHLGRTRAKGISVLYLPHLLQQVAKAEKSWGNFVTKLLWTLFAKEKEEIKALLATNQLPFTKEGLQELHQRLQHSRDFFALKEELSQNTDFTFGEEEGPEGYWETIEEIEKAMLWSENWFKVHEKQALPILFHQLSRTDFLEELDQLSQAIEKVTQAYQPHFSYFTEEHLHGLFKEDLVHRALQELEGQFDAMIEYDRAKESLNFHELQALASLVRLGHQEMTLSGKMDVPRLIAIFDTSIRRSWIQHIEGKYPILRSVSTSTFAALENELSTAIAGKQTSSREILLLKLREQVYRNEEFNRLGNRTTYRDLQHQVTKKKKIWPLRKTLEAFHQEVFYVLPCWLASPETVSAVFPMEELFDLVIFDEASQCFVEKGIPAMARGKQVVVAGDSKQLQPNDLYRTRFNSDDEEVPDTEIDSLLDLASRYLPQVMLTEHYRSQSLDLIDFSNHYFYKQKLVLLPDFRTFQSGHKGIEYVKTDGYFESHCNVREAEHVVSRCLDLFQSQPEKEVGVITFNIHQQHLIQDLLEERCMREKWTIPESFIVKNIENIQGDEKDVIIFSIGYAPDKAGRMQHQFGSLNLAGGENRLNVAVTRAREKIIVVTSIFPPQLQVENTLHEGPKLLRKYLEYALTVSEGRFKPTLSAEKNFRQDWYLKEKLRKQQPHLLSEELPFADLTEKDTQGRIVKLVLTDDDKFFNGLSVKETFSYLPSTFRAKHWTFQRMWSRSQVTGIK
jgi:hypothetical protein